MAESRAVPGRLPRQKVLAPVIAIGGSYMGLAAALGFLLPRYAVSVRHIVSGSAPAIRQLSQLRTVDDEIAAAVSEPRAAEMPPSQLQPLVDQANLELQALIGMARADPTIGGVDRIARSQEDFVRHAVQALHGQSDASTELAALRKHQELDRLIAAETTAMLDEAASTDVQVRKNLRLLAKLVLASAVVVALATLWLVRGALQSLHGFALAQAARQREAEDRARELDLFAAAVAHDLRQPLGAIGLVLHGVGLTPLPAKLNDAVKVGQRSIRRLDEMIRDLLEYARGGGDPAPGDLTHLDEVVAGLQAEFGLRDQARAELVVAVQPGLELAMKPGVVRTILSNLIDNAVNHGADERGVTVRLAAHRQDGTVQLEVADNGPGIPPEVVPHIFERFRRGTVRGSGYGLGLATVQRITRSHHGSIEVTSVLGEGTRFLITLPAAGTASKLPAAAAQDASPSPGQHA